jgi:hypothetical protein
MGTYTRYFVRAKDENMKERMLLRAVKHGIEPIVPDMGYPISKNLYPVRWDSGLDNSRTLSKTLLGIPVYKAIADGVLESVLDEAGVART